MRRYAVEKFTPFSEFPVLSFWFFVLNNPFIRFLCFFVSVITNQPKLQFSNKILPFLFIAFSQCLFISLLFAQQINLHLPPEGLEERKPPIELKLNSILYELAVASDREKFAKEHDIFYYEGKVRVLIFLNPASSIPDRENLVKRYNIVVEKKSNELIRALVPIDELILLSKEPIVWSISLPEKPAIHGRDK